MMSNNTKAGTVKRIWGVSGRLGWSSKTLHDKLVEWGFGASLSALSPAQLKAVQSKIESHYRAVKNDLGSQGRFMYSQMVKAGWDYGRLNCYLVKRFKAKEKYSFADKWRNLSQSHKRGVINMFKNMQK